MIIYSVAFVSDEVRHIQSNAAGDELIRRLSKVKPFNTASPNATIEFIHRPQCQLSPIN